VAVEARHLIGAASYIHTFVDPVEHEPETFLDRMSAALEQRLRDRRPMIVHAASNYRTGLPALIAARRIGVPFVYEVRGLWELTAASRMADWERTERFEFDRRMETLVASEADHVFALTAGLARELAASGVAAEKISLLPNAVDPELYRPAEPDPELASRHAVKDGEFVVVYGGSLVPYEGLDDLIGAVALLRTGGIAARLIIAGAGASRAQLERQVEEEGIKGAVQFAGLVSPAAMRGYLALADVVAVPRKPFRVCEVVSPLKPFEAMAMAKPVVLSDLAALREIVRDRETGRLCRPADRAHLAEILGELAAQPEERVRIGAAARSWVAEHRSWTANAAAVREVHAALAEGGGSLSARSAARGPLLRGDIAAALS
jgi:glycosyltransferase involved in cell wall biosynthesis